MTTPPTAPATASPQETVRRVLLAVFALVLLVDLGSLVVDADKGHWIAKPLLMPLLVALVLLRGGPRLLVAALLFGWGGDVFLLSGAEWAFLAGMGSFAVGHVCYLVLFRRTCEGRPSAVLAPAYGLALVVAVALLWPGLPADLRVPVAGYALLLTAMAWRSSTLGAVAGLGGLFFLVSDLIIASGVAEWPQPPVPDVWIMLIYGAGQLLLTLGVLSHALPRDAAAPSLTVAP
ncbi:lysoplasmalogenase [Streptomyces sp. NPDC048057]|uniref:lysoplasmalogenase n=1 Tax=Streptomyces sp. NPDC048057 TaxID=3155628 RepID=UPI00340E4057